MARKLSEAPQTTRPASPRRRRSPASRRGTAVRVPVRTSPAEPRPVAAPPAAEPAAPGGPLLRWVLVTGADGRTRPEARWS
ncbi:hypothetical protein DEF23_01240 [Marinitenerispora sediminis]|nr:hypothetical protein DEF28_05800 [Marinitenerispora sediminis]RCV61730.1 hypothetical protein DEF23_01240 [Marinitenerispora sediminis]